MNNEELAYLQSTYTYIGYIQKILTPTIMHAAQSSIDNDGTLVMKSALTESLAPQQQLDIINKYHKFLEEFIEKIRDKEKIDNIEH